MAWQQSKKKMVSWQNKNTMTWSIDMKTKVGMILDHFMDFFISLTGQGCTKRDYELISNYILRQITAGRGLRGGARGGGMPVHDDAG